ncbi:tRNA 2-thiouridine(34) synthase MnmA [Corynebacterium choanae]|uniref:tRNA-specific 2-thiouridylase MnmA n=1 Tax=Corynebacterium choanae TaxID=1862358 RepID=A0A3G6J5M5_9CORY|nr:tRNA 2-thiouridine(34) synthase MnmA [Corynebacterium choanae]AZA13357.1 tRNA-specific 2-thiouridylase MnmA [Corynebacterium choanae]
MRVLAAMSGGVDSAVAAARAVAAGHEVTGIHLALSKDPQAVRESSRGCCSIEDSADARRVCDKLGIPFYVWDFSDRFASEVIDDFVASYQIGQTPNPCLRCNEKIKFRALLQRGVALGFDAVATGHYARLTHVADGGDGYLRRAVDPLKDQSYVLGVLSEAEISRCMFPVGDTVKPEIRQEAADLGFSVAKKPDSYDICFIPDGDTKGFLNRTIGTQPGEIVDEAGNRLKTTDDMFGFTIGQRKGLDLRQPAADGKPRYVTGIHPARKQVVVGPRGHLSVGTIVADRLKKLHPDMAGEVDCQVQVRAHGGITDCTARIDWDTDTMELQLHEPLLGVAPGQAAVLYAPQPDGADIVLGSGTITATRRFLQNTD